MRYSHTCYNYDHLAKDESELTTMNAASSCLVLLTLSHLLVIVTAGAMYKSCFDLCVENLSSIAQDGEKNYLVQEYCAVKCQGNTINYVANIR